MRLIPLRWVNIAWVIALLLLVINSAFTSYNINSLIYSDEQVQKTQASRREIAELYFNIVDAETGQRGFLLAGKEEYLAPYNEGSTAVMELLPRLEIRFADDPIQQRNLELLQRQILAKLEEMNLLIELRRTSGSVEVVTAKMSEGFGKRLMDEIRLTAEEMNRHEEEFLRQDSSRARAKYRTTTITTMLGSVMTISMVLLAFVLIKKELQRRHLAEAELIRRAEELRQTKLQQDEVLAQLEAFLSNAPVGIGFLDKELRFLRVNRLLSDINHRTAEEHIQQRFQDLNPEFFGDIDQVVVSSLHPDANPVQIQASTNNSGDSRFWSLGIFPVRYPDGVIIGVGIISEDITRRMRAEQDLRLSENRFRNLAEAVPHIVWVAKRDGTVEYFNSRWFEFTDFTTQQSYGNGWVNALHPEDKDRCIQRWKESASSGRVYEIEYRLRRADGAYRWFLGRGLPQYDEYGNIIRWFGTCTDIHDQKIATDELRSREIRFRNLADSMPQIVWTADNRGLPEYTNQRWYDLLDFDKSHPPSESMFDQLLHPDELKSVRLKWRECVQNQINFSMEHRVWHRLENQYRWYLGRAIPVREGADQRITWYGTWTDIDDYKRLNETLRETLEKFRVLTEALPQMVWTTDPAGTITYYNSRWIEYTGISVENSAVSDWTQVVHPEDVQPLMAHWEETLRSDTNSYSHQFRLRGPDHNYRWFLSRAVALRSAEGKIVQWFGTLTDIDQQVLQAEYLENQVRLRTADLLALNQRLTQEVIDRTRAEDKEKLVSVELRRSNEELEKFAYIASHDLQEPLRKIQAFGDRLDRKYSSALDTQGREYVERMLNSATRMRTLINDLLTFSRVTSRGRGFVEVDLQQVLNGVLSDLEILLQQTGATVESEGLPILRADPSQMRQVFQNLIGNAIKFARPGVAPQVKIKCQVLPEVQSDSELPKSQFENGWRLVFSDNGIGFEQIYAERIFELFQRLHGRSEFEGTGIGLAVCKKIIERHGGLIFARGRSGEGADFIIDLPVTRPEEVWE